MIVKDFYTTREDGVKLYRTYSNAGYYIKQVETGAIYEEAVDIEGSVYTYQETDKLIPVEVEKQEEQ